MKKPNLAEAHLHMEAGSLPPLYVRDCGALYWVPGVKKYLVERKKCFHPTMPLDRDEQTTFIWTNDEEMGLDMIQE